MDKNFYADKIDAYINFELSEREKVMFEQMIEQDPILKSELEFQQEIVDAIRFKRKLELKSRLDKVPIDSIQIFHLPRLALAGTLVAASLIMGVLVFFEYKEEQVIKNITSKISNHFPKNESIVIRPEKSTESTELSEVSPSNQLNSNEESINDEQKEVWKKQGVKDKNKSSNTKNNQLVLEESISKIATLPTSKDKPTQKANDLGITEQISKLNLSKIDKEDKSRKKIGFVLDKESYIDIPSLSRKDTDNDVGIFDGKNESTLENSARINKLSYQHYNGVLFVYNDNASRKEQFTLNDNGVVRHFLYYEETFYEFFTDVTTTTEMLLVTDTELVELLSTKRKEIIKK